MRRLIPILLWAVSMLWSGAGRAQFSAEMTFDDQEAGTGPASGHAVVDNMESGGEPIVLTGTAVRTAIRDGRYGRGINLDGQGTVTLPQWRSRDAGLVLWLALRDGGVLVQQAGAFLVSVSTDQVLITAQGSGASQTLSANIAWPADSGFHHLHIGFEKEGNATTFSLSVDFGPATVVQFPFAVAEPDAGLVLGGGVVGVLDEVIVSHFPTIFPAAAAANLAHSRDPQSCAAGLQCVEEVFIMRPRNFPHDVPVRMKVSFDPARCRPQSPCELLLSVNGGATCANDYSSPDTVAAYAAEGLVVATVDPYCEGDQDTDLFSTENSQLIAAKDYLFTQSIFRDRIAEGPYFAEGNSHGADAVLIWALFEQDHPSRTFARSGTGAGLCPVFAGARCGVEVPGNVDVESAQFRQRHERGDFLLRLTPEQVAGQQIARSWGVNLEGPICNPDGSAACMEEGQLAYSYASRRFRDVWEAVQSAEAPTGYFVEDRSADCRHSAAPDTKAFQCGACMLAHGRGSMQATCPECLDYSDPTIDRGQEAALCPLAASWYVDPIAELREATDSGVITDTGDGSDSGGAADSADAPDAEVAPDGGAADAGMSPDAAEATPSDRGGEGCSCSLSSTAESAAGALVLLLGLVRRRRRTRL